MPELIAFLTAEALTPLFKELLRIRRKRKAEINAISDTFGDPVELAKFYIEPRCQHQNPADFNEDEPISVVRSQVFATVNDFFNREFSSRGGGKNVMFVLSDAGMGKTSLLVMMKLLHLTEFWPTEFSCELLKLGSETIEQISQIPNKGRTILLLDSLDEDPLSWDDTERRLLQILATTETFRRVVVTCRTQYFPKTASDPFNRPGRVELGGYISPMLFLSYFDETQVDEYLAKRFPGNLIQRARGMRSREHVRAKSLLSKVNSLQFRPFLLAHIEDLLASERTDWDDFGIYEALLQAWLLREERKLRTQGHDIRSGQLLKACTEVALLMSASRQREVSREELEALILSSPSVALVKDLNFGGRALLNRNSLGHFRFSHYSIQEFLLAHCILNDKLAEKYRGVTVTDQTFNFIYARLEAVANTHRVVDTTMLHEFILKSGEVPTCKNCGMSEKYAEHTRQGSCVVSRRIDAFSFSGLRFDDLDLSGKKLSGHVFNSCSFTGTNLSEADLSSCDLRNAVFDRANLRNTNLRGAWLEGASLAGSTLDYLQSDQPLPAQD